MMRCYDEAIAEYRRGLELDPNSPETHRRLAQVYTYARAGRVAEARRIAEQVKTGPVQLREFGLALVAAGLGRREEALARLERLAAEGLLNGSFYSIPSFPFDDLRSDPRPGCRLRDARPARPFSLVSTLRRCIWKIHLAHRQRRAGERRHFSPILRAAKAPAPTSTLRATVVPDLPWLASRTDSIPPWEV